MGRAEESLGVALKASAGSAQAATATTCAVLAQVRGVDPRADETLHQYREPAIVNLGGAVVGGYRSVFTLKAGV